MWQNKGLAGCLSFRAIAHSLLLVFDIIILWPTNLLCSLCYSFWPLAIFDNTSNWSDLFRQWDRLAGQWEGPYFRNYIFMGRKVSILVRWDLATETWPKCHLSLHLLYLIESTFCFSHRRFHLYPYSVDNLFKPRVFTLCPKNALSIKLSLMGWVQYHTSCADRNN